LPPRFTIMPVPERTVVPERAEAAWRASEALKSAILDTALDCIVTIDHQGRILDFNPAAERTFGYTRSEAIGREMAELIIPPFLRERHRLGLARAVATGRDTIVGQRIEITAMRKGGEEIPVELAITRIPLGDVAIFTGHIRDISERKQAERRLAAQYSVARILAEAGNLVEAAPKIIQAVCESLDWDLGTIWNVEPESNELRCADLWHASEVDVAEFAAATRRTAFSRGVGLPGRVWSTRQPAWIADVANDSNFPRGPIAEQNSLHGAFAFPIMLEGEVLGVFEFFSRQIREPSQPILAMFLAIGSQLGQFIERQNAEHELRKSQLLLASINADLERRITVRTAELSATNERLKKETESRELKEREEQERLKASLQRHRTLLRLTQHGSLEWHELLPHLLAEDARTLGVERVSFWRFTSCDQRLERQGLYLLSRDQFSTEPDHLEVAHYQKYFGALAGRLEPIVAANCREDAQLQEFNETYFIPHGIRSTLDIPVHLNGKLYGVIWHEHIGPLRGWSTEVIDFTRAIAQMVALAIESHERRQTEAALRASEARLRESEERFSKAFRASPVIVSIARFNDGRFIEANEAFLGWCGFKREEVIGRTSLELGLWANPADRGKFLEELRERRYVHSRESVFRSKTGRVDTLLLSAEMIEIEGAEHILAVSLDISARKQAEEEMRKALEREKELSRLKSNFVTLVSHEFRTPLGIIMSSADILKNYFERLAPARRNEHLRDIHDASLRMAELMDEILVLARLESDKTVPKVAHLDLRELCQRLADETLSATGRVCPIQFSSHGLQEKATVDEALFRLIIGNLLSNAVKYSTAGRPVHFAAERTGTQVAISVTDAGIGIPEADLKELFQAFHRGSNVGQKPGTGLGLVIVKRCVDLHGGTIEVQSKIGLGTTFVVRLTVFAEERPRPERPISTMHYKDSKNHRASKKPRSQP
jgi:PAS domain S-box-containing protein